MVLGGPGAIVALMEAPTNSGEAEPEIALLRWVRTYMMVMLCAGFVFYFLCSLVSPMRPDLEAGIVYRVPARRSDFYVDEVTALVLRFLAVQVGAILLIGLVQVAWNRLSSVPRDGRYGQRPGGDETT